MSAARTGSGMVSVRLDDSVPDGLYVILEPTPRGEAVLRENPYLGVSARIVEQYSRADGQFFPAAIQHVLGTLDPRIPGLGSWQPVEMANGGDSAVTIDLSNLSFAAEPATASTGYSLNDRELAELMDVWPRSRARTTATAVSCPTPSWRR